YANDLDEFYRLPHALFDNPFYKKLSPDAIITYAIYLSRYEYSVFKDNFYDKDQKLYFIYPNDALGDYLNFNRKKIARIKKQLIDFNLLEVKPSNRADMLYIKPPKASHGVEIKKWDTSDTDYSNTNISDIDSSDTNDMNDIRKANIENTKHNHPNHTNHLQQQSDEEALKYLELQEMPEDTKRYMNNFSAKEIQIIKSVILKAKRSFNDMYDEMYMLED